MRRLMIIAMAALALTAGCSGNSQLAPATGSSAGSGSGSGSGAGTGTGTTKLALGSGSGASFQSGAIAISSTSLSAGGSTSLQVSLVDQTGALYTTSTTITFSSPCESQGLASIAATGVTPASPSVTTASGTASATYVASGCSGSDVITATTTANNQSLTATGTVTVATAAIGSIAFVSATPASITLKGVGNAGGSATSTVIFKVLDTSGGPRAGATVNFALNTNVGGISLSPASAVSDANGQVQTIVSGGTVATTVRVTAATTAGGGATISTQSNALTVTTGIPSSANISLAVGCYNVEAWGYDGVTVPVTVRMTDRFSNPVPNGTTANFQTALGGIDPSCQTTSASGGSGLGSGTCGVNWVSKAPDSISGNPQSTAGNANASPAYCSGIGKSMGLCNSTTNGRSPILVTAIGEESFKDADGSGYFNPKDTVAWDATNKDNNFPSGAPKPWQDTSEPFLNEWELYDSYGTPIWVSGEWFLDFNNNNLRDGPDGLVQSALCQGPLCSTAGSTVAIGQSNIIILSGSHANLNVLTDTNPAAVAGVFHFNGGTSTGAAGPPEVLVVDIYDDRLQQMPAGTKVAASISAGATAVITNPPPAAWPCSAAPPYINAAGDLIAGQSFTFVLAPATPAPQTGQVGGTLYITVTTPGNNVAQSTATTFGIPIQP